MKRSVERTPIPLKTRQLIVERSRLVCEACSAARASHIHHRKLRSQGGTNDAVNLLHLCSLCHLRIHANPGDSYSRGLLVKSYLLPAMVPVWAYDESEKQQ